MDKKRDNEESGGEGFGVFIEDTNANQVEKIPSRGPGPACNPEKLAFDSKKQRRPSLASALKKNRSLECGIRKTATDAPYRYAIVDKLNEALLVICLEKTISLVDTLARFHVLFQSIPTEKLNLEGSKFCLADMEEIEYNAITGVYFNNLFYYHTRDLFAPFQKAIGLILNIQTAFGKLGYFIKAKTSFERGSGQSKEKEELQSSVIVPVHVYILPIKKYVKMTLECSFRESNPIICDCATIVDEFSFEMLSLMMIAVTNYLKNLGNDETKVPSA